ncbi:CGH_3_HP_G0030840.mRNA.1.CDS.1 [Saccharomyces cerevisiae]|nr:CGH_3_HP_G0030840.mRNA.1.CDS.1 [Saccharomyces cerevisiae]CAI6465700.1 CGH_3_HP_G0030840.mRNA.1.CDS.1 [Saccharomyces cerevisiae]
MDSSNPFCLPNSNTSSYSNATYNGEEVKPSIDCRSMSTYNDIDLPPTNIWKMVGFTSHMLTEHLLTVVGGDGNCIN